MTPVDQTIICSERGDCMRATVASLFDLELEQVPHFRLFDDKTWFDIYYYFLYGLGYEYAGYNRVHKERKLEKKYSINGYFDACVPSKTFEGASHAVIIDLKGVVVHDPNPNKAWQGVNVLKSGELKGWYAFKKRVNA